MTIIDDLRLAIENYATDNCKFQFVDVEVPGQVINLGENN